MYTENSVRFITDNLVLINKEGCKTCIARSTLGYVIVFKLDVYYQGTNLVTLVKKLDNASSYVKFMYLIGKMCRKDVSSKYFAKNRYKEHFSNGDELGEIEKAFLQEFLQECVREISRTQDTAAMEVIVE